MVAIEELLVGPAVVVDDKFGNQEDASLEQIVGQLRDASIPIVGRTSLPDREELRHWRGYSLVILDWELISPPDGGEVLGPGISIPEGLSKSNATQVVEFIDQLVGAVYCPIFLFSNQSPEAISREIYASTSLPESVLRARLLVMPKSQVAEGLFDELSKWFALHPAVYALKVWQAGHAEAVHDFFSELEASSSSWPCVLWETSLKDGTDPASELSESIGRNMQHRMRPLAFDDKVMAPSAGYSKPLPGSLRRVVHRSAVIGGAHLSPLEIMPGDLFYSEALVEGLPEKILINITPACDLVPRKGTKLADVRLTLLHANLVPKDQLGSNKKYDDLEKRSGSPSAEVMYVLLDSIRPYVVSFRDWSHSSWAEVGEMRSGRLIEPYITQLQQKFAFYFHRQGIPRLPAATRHLGP